MIEQYIVGGLAAGSVYALMALGMILIFKTTDVVNFAQADMTMFSAFVAWSLLVWYQQPFYIAILAAVACGIVLGFAAERLALRPAKNAPVISLLITTLGVALILNAFAGWIWGYDTKAFPYVVKGTPLFLGSVIIRRHDLLIFAVALVLSVGLFAALKFTRLGTAMRATAQNRLAAQLMGINVDRINAISWATGAAIGAVAGFLIAPVISLDLNVMVLVMLKGFAAAVLGGFTSLPGAIVGGLLLGVMENLIIAIPSELVNQFKDTFVFILIIVILAVRPHGLLGEPVLRRF